MRRNRLLPLIAFIFVAASAGRSQCVAGEFEPNGDKAQASLAVLGSGQSFCGDFNGIDQDYWRIRTAGAPHGVYRHELDAGISVLGTLGASILGLTQANGMIVPGTDVLIQSNQSSAQSLAWYGFGQGEEVFILLSGANGLQYQADLTTTQVTPVVIGPFVRGGGSIEFRTIPTTHDTELWLYRVESSGAITAVPDAGNDDALSGGPASRLTRFLPLGRYLLAVGLANMANNLRSPAEDANRNRPVLDFPKGIAAGAPQSSSVPVTIPLHIQDSQATHTFSGTLNSFFEILWFEFEVVERVAFTLPSDLEATPGNVNTPVPFTQTSNARMQYAHQSTGMPQVPMTIRNLSVRMRTPSQADPTGLNLAALEVVLGTTTDINALGGNFQNNLVPGSSQVVRSGPFNSGPVAAASGGSTGQWISLGLTAPFVYDPCAGLDLLIEVTKCGVISMLDGNNDAHNTLEARRVGAVGTSATFCSSPPATGSVSTPGQSFSLVFLVEADTTVVPDGNPFQVNSPEANVNFDGQQTDGSTPLVVGYGSGGPGAMLNLQSALAGLVLFDLAIGLGATGLLPFDPCLGGPALRTPEGQIVNLDLLQPVIFLNGLSFLPLPPGSGLSLLANVPGTAVLSAAIQGIFLDGTHPEGFRLSAASQITFAPLNAVSGTTPGPNVNDGHVTVPVGGLKFYDRIYTEMHVSSNGRVVFEGPDDDPTPSVPEAIDNDPWVGAWVDLDPGAGGSITISSPSAQRIRVDYVAVPYRAAPQQTATFFIEFDASLDRVTLGGLSGIQPAPGVDMLLGTSMGLGDPVLCGTGPGGQTPFSTTGLNQPTCPLELLHQHGPAGTLAPGVSILIFDAVTHPDPSITLSNGLIPNVWNYAWTGQ